MIDECFEKAGEVLKGNATRLGVIAGRQFYNDIWGRDGLITCLGMSSSGDRRLVELSERTIETIAKSRKKNGQLPNKISIDGRKVCFGEGGCVDTSLWYPIAVLNHYLNTNDSKFLKRHADKIEKAVSWLSCLDQNNDCLIEVSEASDWMDLLVRSGRVLYDEVLYYAALKSAGRILKELGRNEGYSVLAKRVRENINLFFWPDRKNLRRVTDEFGYSHVHKDFVTLLGERKRDYYFAEVGFRRYDPRCDVFANVLSIISGVADREKSDLIFRHFDRDGIHEPYPVKCLWPPIGDDDPYRCFYYRWTDLPHLQKPGNYHNGGIWPYIGGFYVIALKKEGREHRRMMERLAEANRLGKNDYEFNEWLDCNGTPMGSAYQSWSAGMYMLAYQYKRGNILL